jgi:tetratricopeptide (TPR) repeat protein
MRLKHKRLSTSFMMGVCMIAVAAVSAQELQWRDSKYDSARQEQFGDDFLAWHDARELHLSDRFDEARAAYAKLAHEFPDTVYAEGARFHAAESLLELGEVRKATEEFAEFAKSQPLGLWRGEALFNLGEIHLRHEFDTKAAHEAFEKVVDWVNTVRDLSDDEVSLAKLPEVVKYVTLPSEQPLKQVGGELVPADVEPRMVINRRTTDWYLDRLAWNAFYNLGFLAAVDDDWDTAKHLWTRAFNMNEQLQKQYANQIGSLHLRLMCAVRGRCFVARPYELDAYKGRRNRERRIKLMLADLDALRLKWASAEQLYHELIDDRSTTDEQKAVALRCLGTAMFFQERRDESQKIMEELVEKYSKYPSSYKALVFLAKLQEKNLEKSLALLKQAEKIAVSNEDAAAALDLTAAILNYTHGKHEEARRVWLEVKQKYPETYWGETAEDKIRASRLMEQFHQDMKAGRIDDLEEYFKQKGIHIDDGD